MPDRTLHKAETEHSFANACDIWNATGKNSLWQIIIRGNRKPLRRSIGLWRIPRNQIRILGIR